MSGESEPAEGSGGGSGEGETGFRRRLRRLLLGPPLAPSDPGLLSSISLGAFLAWVALGADGISSSSYGPAEAFRALGEHTYLAVLLAGATAVTILVISLCYAKIIEQFPSGGGGYAVASKFLGPGAGMVSGTALVVDYVLTIAVSIAAGAAAIFSFLPAHWLPLRVPVAGLAILALTVLNIRRVRESTAVPLFVLFLLTHVVLIVGGALSHIDRAPELAGRLTAGWSGGLATLGGWGVLLLFLRAYSMGAGTYTGIEAVSNGVGLLREPRVATGRRTMLLLAVSLAFTAGGIILCYLLFDVHPAPGKTMNALLAEAFSEGWSLGPLPVGRIFVVLTLTSEALLLLLAAQTGFSGGPRVMASMAVDSWLPHRFATLSDRLTTRDGILLMGCGAAALVIYTKGSVTALVVMYSINVFLTFSLSQAAMVRHWLRARRAAAHRGRNLAIHLAGLALCLSILVVTVVEKFGAGGWLTLALTGSALLLCLLVRRHYRRTWTALARLEEIFGELPTRPGGSPIAPFDPVRPTAVLLVGSYGGLGIHSMLSIQKVFPGLFKNIVFLSVAVLDSGNFKGVGAVDQLRRKVESDLQKYVALAERLRWPARYEMAVGLEAVSEGEKLCRDISHRYPRAVFFAGKLIFRRERWYQRILHNETAFAVQKRLQVDGIPMTVLPVRLT